jgi:hypothetical protein
MSKLGSTQKIEKRQEFKMMFRVEYGQMACKNMINMNNTGI